MAPLVRSHARTGRVPFSLGPIPEASLRARSLELTRAYLAPGARAGASAVDGAGQGGQPVPAATERGAGGGGPAQPPKPAEQPQQEPQPQRPAEERKQPHPGRHHEPDAALRLYVEAGGGETTGDEEEPPLQHSQAEAAPAAAATAQAQQHAQPGGKAAAVPSRAASILRAGSAASHKVARAAGGLGAGGGAVQPDDDPLLQPEVLGKLNIKMDGKKVGPEVAGLRPQAGGPKTGPACRARTGGGATARARVAGGAPKRKPPPTAAQVDAANVRPADWERLRAGIALKTFTALIKQYRNLSEKQEAAVMREARRFARGLFWNVKGGEGRRYITRADFDAFFDDREIADQVGWRRGLGRTGRAVQAAFRPAGVEGSLRPLSVGRSLISRRVSRRGKRLWEHAPAQNPRENRPHPRLPRRLPTSTRTLT